MSCKAVLLPSMRPSQPSCLTSPIPERARASWTVREGYTTRRVGRASPDAGCPASGVFLRRRHPRPPRRNRTGRGRLLDSMIPPLQACPHEQHFVEYRFVSCHRTLPRRTRLSHTEGSRPTSLEPNISLAGSKRVAFSRHRIICQPVCIQSALGNRMPSAFKTQMPA